jgi:hypothetical protein
LAGPEFCFRKKKDRVYSAELAELSGRDGYFGFRSGIAETFDTKKNIRSLP